MSRTALLIVINYNSEDDVASLVRSVRRLPTSDQCDILVVSTAVKNRDKLKSLAARFSITLEDALDNPGYFGGAALGLKRYLAANPAPTWIIVANADIHIDQQDFFERLFQPSRTKDESIGVIAPAVISSQSARDQNPHMRTRPSKLRMHSYKWLFRLRSTFAMFEALSELKRRATRSQDLDEPATSAIYAAHGSFVIIHQNYFNRGGSLNYPIRLFGEEIFLAETARNLQLRVLHDTTLQVHHKEHVSTKKLKNRWVLHARAARYIADKYFGSAS